jgi:RNA polymerase sigma factor FliA
MPRIAPERLATLWDRWVTSRSPVDKADLVDAYTGYVRVVAAQCYAGRISQELEFRDYMQFGMVGLLEALDRFDPGAGVKFETFAGHRVRGAILNGVENLSEVQKQAMVRHRVLRERTASLSALRSDARASALERLAEVAIGLALGFALEESGSYLPETEPSSPDNAYRRVEWRQLQERLAAAVQSLTEQERFVIRRHYYQQQPFDLIAATMGLTKGRVSQIHRSALLHLKEAQKRHAWFKMEA